MHVVQKPFEGNEGPYERGELIDATDFRNLNALVEQRYLRPATADEIENAVEYEEEEEVPVRKPMVIRAKKAKKKGGSR